MPNDRPFECRLTLPMKEVPALLAHLDAGAMKGGRVNVVQQVLKQVQHQFWDRQEADVQSEEFNRKHLAMWREYEAKIEAWHERYPERKRIKPVTWSSGRGGVQYLIGMPSMAAARRASEGKLDGWTLSVTGNVIARFLAIKRPGTLWRSEGRRDDEYAWKPTLFEKMRL